MFGGWKKPKKSSKKATPPPPQIKKRGFLVPFSFFFWALFSIFPSLFANKIKF
jgi:hypothetical protein